MKTFTIHAFIMMFSISTYANINFGNPTLKNRNSNTSDEIKADTSKKKEEMAPIATDRPDQTETPYLVPKGMFQIETGAWVEFDKNDNYRTRNSAYNTTLFKAGLSENFELRLITEFLGNTMYNRRNNEIIQSDKGMNSVAIGSKLFICEEKGLRPKISLITHVQLPYFGAKVYRPGHLAPRFRFTMLNTISDRLSLSYNLGAEWDGDSDAATGIYTVSLAISLIKSLGMYVESYGFLGEHSNNDGKFDGTFSNDHRFDGGFTYLLRNNLQLDCSAGIGISKDSPDGFVSIGASYRFPR